jgi:hypothetical protein
MPNSYNPTAKMIRSLFESHGFSEYKSVKELAIGGLVFFREHSDGRLQMVYVFSWSNFRIAEKKGTSPCILWVRSTVDAGTSREDVWRSAPNGIAVSIPFKPDEWDSVKQRVDGIIIPAFDASTDEGNRLLEEAAAQNSF